MSQSTIPQIYRCFFLLLLIAFVSTAIAAQIQVRVKFGKIANLTYQLDCVANLPVNCSAASLNELWKREFLKTEEDRLLLKEWKRLRELYSENVPLGKSSGAYLSLFDKIRIAGFQANNIEDYTARLDLLTNPGDRRLFERVIRHFEVPFNLWWQRKAFKFGNQFAKQTDVLLRSPKISASIKQFYDFYSPVLPANYQISFNLLYIPDLAKEPSSGQQLQNYSLMEFKAKERPAQRIDIAVHELCHFFYDSMPPQFLDQLRTDFNAQNQAAAVPAYNLMNEALASAFGNGIIARAVTPPAEYEKYVSAKLSFYNNDAVDRAAKALLPWLDDFLKNKRTIKDAEFASQYVSVLVKALGDDLLKPKLYLSEMFLFVDKKYNVSMRRSVRRALETTSFYASEGDLTDDKILEFYKAQLHLNSVFIVHPDNIAELSHQKIISEAQMKQIRDEISAKQSVLFGAERASFTYVYILVAKDSESAMKLVEKLARADRFLGIYQD